MNIKTIGVAGCGLMGSGIVENCARKGYNVVVLEATEDLLARGMKRIRSSTGRALERGKASQQDIDQMFERIRTTTTVEDFADCDYVIEAITENMEDKKRLFGRLEEITRPEVILASNTSSLAIIEIASMTKRPDKVVGLHFFNPVPVMPLAELVRTIATSDETLRVTEELAKSLGKEIIVAKDTPGFIVNLLLVPFMCDAVRAVEHGVASVEDIDKGMKLGCGMPMGPLTLLDFVGVDTTYYIANIMFDEFKDPRYAAPPLLKRMVLAGRLGRKSGRGFYDYNK